MDAPSAWTQPIVKESNSNSEYYIKRVLSPFALFMIILSYPVLSMFWRYQYPMLSAESILFFALIALSSLVLAIMTTACRPWLTNIIFTFCITLVLVLQFNLFFEGFTAVLATGLLLAFVSGRQFPQLAFTVFVALVIGAFIDSRLDHTRNHNRVAAEEQRSSMAPVVHILLDGFIGPHGLPPQDITQAQRSEIIEFFRDNGFDLYSRAYSHYHTTLDSLTRAFNFTNDPANLSTKVFLMHENYSIPDNRYFELLHRAGYRVNVYQSESVDFCKAVPEAVDRCMIYNIPNLDTIRENVPSPWVRLWVLATGLINQSTLYGLYVKKAKWATSWGVTLYQPKVIDEIVEALEQTRSGVHFAHLLLPHTPWVYRSDCQLDYSTEAWKRFQNPGVIRNTVDTRAVRYLRYLPQISCALSELGRLFDRMRELGLYNDSIIVVHGDHGSRITLHSASYQNRDKLTPEDYRDLFSTLFAIRLPGGKFREHTEPVPLNVMMYRAAVAITGQKTLDMEVEADAEQNPYVYLTGQFPLSRQDIDIFAVP